MAERREEEALVVCGDRSMSAGITIWNVSTGDRLLHIPTCASPPHGIVCLRNRYLVASQVHKHGSLGGGSISIWPLNKPHAMLHSYPVESIGPLCSTRDGIYLAGGAPSGRAYIWEVLSGRLLKSWRAHNTSLTCMRFSSDDSLLISGSNDGMICVWSLLGLLDVADCADLPSLLNSTLEHFSSISGLISTSGSSCSFLISSSLDGTCKVWEVVTGRLLQTQAYAQAITAIVVDLGEQLLFSGSTDGRIFVNKLDIGLVGDLSVVSEDQSFELNGHNGAITALIFSKSGLISASEDCTACLWDVVTWVIIQRFSHDKGPITNLMIIPQLSMLSIPVHQNIAGQFRVSPLEKIPGTGNNTSGTICPLKDHGTGLDLRSCDIRNQQIHDLETPAATQMEIETSIENRLWSVKMTKHVMEMNRHLQSRLPGLIQARLQKSPENGIPEARKRKKPKVEGSPFLGCQTQPAE